MVKDCPLLSFNVSRFFYADLQTKILTVDPVAGTFIYPGILVIRSVLLIGKSTVINYFQNLNVVLLCLLNSQRY